MSNRIHTTSRRDDNDPNALTLTGFKIVPKEYWRVRAIFAETGQSDTVLKRALKEGHGIDPEKLTPDTVLYFVVSEQQMKGLHDAEIDSPTWLQLLGTSEVIDIDQDDAERRYRELKQEP